jgi:glycosyltransferase involved in cell wall biosynthesis
LVCNARLPSEKAHPYQVMQMWQAFSRQGASCLLHPFRFQQNRTLPSCRSAFWEYYDFDEAPGEHHCLPTLDAVHVLKILPRAVHAYSRLQQLSFALSLAFFFAQKKNRCCGVWSREILPLPLLSRLYPRLPLFYEMHRFPGSQRERQIAWLQRIRGVICISRALKKELMSAGYPEEKILWAPDAYNAERFRKKLSPEKARRKLSLPLEGKIIVYTGHLYAWKGVDTLVQAARQCGDCDFYLVGGMAEDLESLRERHVDFPKNIHLKGHRNPREIPLWLSAADVAVLPNSAKTRLGREYTSPLKLFEAMAFRVPLVVSDLPSLREIVDDSMVRFFVADDSLSLARVLKEALRHPKLSEEMAERAFEKVKDNTWEQRAASIRRFMEKHMLEEMR